MSEQKIENKLYGFLNDKMDAGEAPDITNIRRFKDYLCTSDNGIVIDCADGTQVRLTIQVS